MLHRESVNQTTLTAEDIGLSQADLDQQELDRVAAGEGADADGARFMGVATIDGKRVARFRRGAGVAGDAFALDRHSLFERANSLVCGGLCADESKRALTVLIEEEAQEARATVRWRSSPPVAIPGDADADGALVPLPKRAAPPAPERVVPAFPASGLRVAAWRGW